MSVAVIKSGAGNTASVMFALERLGATAMLTDDPKIVLEAERVVLPGVGTASHAMERLHVTGLADVLRNFDRPLLGICLGQQLLFERSEEGDAEGLGLLPGRVEALPSSAALPSPHMGWSALDIRRPSLLFDGVPDGAYVYFVHSYACPVAAYTSASAQYGRPFAAAVESGKRFGCQFHPERSGATGARVLKNFLEAPC